MPDLTVSAPIDAFMAATTAEQARAAILSSGRFAFLRSCDAADPFLLTDATEGAISFTSIADATLTKRYPIDTAETYVQPLTGNITLEGGNPIVSQYTVVGGAREGVCGSFEFFTDALKIQVQVVDSIGAKSRVLVDGRYITGEATSTDYVQYLTIVFGSSTTRRITIQGGRKPTFEAGANGIRVAAADTVWKTPRRPEFILLGDSVSQGFSVVTSNGNGYVAALAQMLGMRFRGSGYIGTGYLQKPSGNNTYRERIPVDLVGLNPEFIIVQGSTNDTVSTVADVRTEARLCWAALRSAYPYTPIMVTSTPGSIRSTPLNDMNAGLLAEFNAWGDTNSKWFSWYDIIGTAGRWNVSNVHPADAGHLYMARTLKAAIRDWLQ